MSERPAEHLARIKRRFPLWSIRPAVGGLGWHAERPDHPNIYGVSLDDLEAQLYDADGGRRPRAAVG